MGKPKSSLQQDDLTPSTLPADHTIVKLGAAQGSGNYLSLDAEGGERLVELSGRVKRSKIIITRGEPGPSFLSPFLSFFPFDFAPSSLTPRSLLVVNLDWERSWLILRERGWCVE